MKNHEKDDIPENYIQDVSERFRAKQRKTYNDLDGSTESEICEAFEYYLTETGFNLEATDRAFDRLYNDKNFEKAPETINEILSTKENLRKAAVILQHLSEKYRNQKKMKIKIESMKETEDGIVICGLIPLPRK